MKLELNEILFLKFFNINKIDIKNKSFLCAVSGGVDSMVLNDLLNKSKLNFSVASCNYKLRKESDQEIEMIR
jgi:tRNA(Ile)-lysidine synthase